MSGFCLHGDEISNLLVSNLLFIRIALKYPRKGTVSAPASYSRVPVFETRPENRLT
jgi:hypothetical protein